MTTRHARPHIESLAVLDRDIEAIDCEDLQRANGATLARMHESCLALLAAIEAEAEFRTPRASVSRRPRVSPAWTTAQFRLQEVSERDE